LDVSVVIVNFNSTDVLRECISSVQATVPSTLRSEIIVVDNGSQADPSRQIQREFPDVTLIRNEANVGFSRANNQGVARSTGRHVLFLNPDTVVRAGTVETMLTHLERLDNAGAATCYVELSTGRLDDASHRGFPTPWNALCHFTGISRLFPRSRTFSRYALGWADLATTHEVDAVAGCFMFVRRDAGEQVGWWDEDYFFYGEDIDFCYRLKNAGWKIYFVPDASILHYKGSSSGIRRESRGVTSADHATKRRATLARFDAMKTFYRKHYLERYPRPLTWLVFRAIDFKQWVALRSL